MYTVESIARWQEGRKCDTDSCDRFAQFKIKAGNYELEYCSRCLAQIVEAAKRAMTCYERVGTRESGRVIPMQEAHK